MGELVIQYHDFENAKKEIKKFSEQTTTDLDLKRVDDSKGVGDFLGDWFLGVELERTTWSKARN